MLGFLDVGVDVEVDDDDADRIGANVPRPAPDLKPLDDKQRTTNARHCCEKQRSREGPERVMGGRAVPRFTGNLELWRPVGGAGTE
jgi:hypothetical protein